MATIVALCEIENGHPKWMSELTLEEQGPVSLALINHNDDTTVGLYAITGPPAVLHKITKMKSVTKILEKGKEDTVLDDTVSDKLSAKSAKRLSRQTAGETAAFICQNLHTRVRVDYNTWSLRDYDDYSKELADAGAVIDEVDEQVDKP
jgi:hypothetical protein